MKYKYKKRYEHHLRLSERQLEQISALHIISLFMEDNKLKNIPNINPKWIEIHKYKTFPIYHFEKLQKKGFVDLLRFKIRKAKKGYVLEMKFNWRSKGIETKPLRCIRCKKIKKLNWHQFCEKCTKEVGGSRGIDKFYRKLWKE